jgi:hypothetical protein
VVEEVDEHRQAQRVRQQDELLAPVGGDVSDVGQEVNSRKPLGLGERLFDGELVEMTDQRGHQVAQAGIGAVVEPGDHLSGELAGGGARRRHTVHSYPT